MNKKVLLYGLALFALSANAQAFKEGYITSGVNGTNLPEVLDQWSASKTVSDDDNFYISRVKPRVRFRNAATQVDKTITVATDKKLINWLPWNDPQVNALPNGKYDQEVFSMWQYITHWGDWSAPLGRIPAALLDVAHKNGVAVSSVAGIPFGSITQEWNNILTRLSSKADVSAQFLRYYGIDGLGYNSEFTSSNTLVERLQDYHADLVKKSRETNPIFENIWYDGTTDSGSRMFDNGLGSHNEDNFGDSDNPRTSLFFNYNWNSTSLLQSSVNKARSMGRDPLDLYVGINMQGGEPRSGERWPMLNRYPLSIGLWGAHTRNMFWESRNELGASPEVQQRTYLLRTEMWYTGGTRNPANHPALNNSFSYSARNTSFGGMSPMMTAKSTLKWNLDEEPFITYFNLGNGKFFNWKGERQNNNEWANVGVQDYLPTWRWWFSTQLLSGAAADVPANGLGAEFVWDDAYVGGSTLRIFGTHSNEYLHLFKTEYALKAGDVITMRYKLKQGQVDAKLVLTAKGAETTAIDEANFSVLETSDRLDDDVWVEKTFTVGSNLDGKDLALVALHFENANNLSLYLGEFSIVRGTAETPVTPVIKSSAVLSNNYAGVDGKLIFDMPNTKAAGEPCYNTDVKTSLFKIYAQQEGGEQKFMGITTSWAALIYSAPIDNTLSSNKVRFGVSAVSLDMKSESAIAWTDEYKDAGTYVYNNEIKINKSYIVTGEEFTLSYVDGKHESGTWTIKKDGVTKFTGTGNSVTCSGLNELGYYDLEVTGKIYAADGSTTEQTIVHNNYLAVSDPSKGAIPEILSLKANDSENTVTVEKGTNVTLSYTGRPADGTSSRGIDLAEKPIAIKMADAGINSMKDTGWSFAFWVKFNYISGGTQILDLRSTTTSWPQNNWGVIWSTYSPGDKSLTVVQRENNNNEHRQRWNVEFKEGLWTHVVYAFEIVNGGVRNKLYINGKLANAREWSYASNRWNTGYNNTGLANPAWFNNSYLYLGIGRHQTAAINGVVDDVKFFKKALTEDEVKATMFSSSVTESGLYGFWDFEAGPSTSDNLFANKVTSNNLGLGYMQFVQGQREGQSIPQGATPIYGSGCPFVEGLAYPVTTTATWSSKRAATFSDKTGNDQAGTIKVQYDTEGSYPVTLTLANGIGSDERTFSFINVTAPTSISGVSSDDAASIYTVGEDVVINLPGAGAYGVQVYNVAGQQVVNKNLNVSSGEQVRMHLANAGVYIVKLTKDGKNLKTMKLIRK